MGSLSMYSMLIRILYKIYLDYLEFQIIQNIFGLFRIPNNTFFYNLYFLFVYDKVGGAIIEPPKGPFINTLGINIRSLIKNNKNSNIVMDNCTKNSSIK